MQARILAFLISLPIVGCQTRPTKAINDVNETAVYDAIVRHELGAREPLTGDFKKGLLLLQMSSGQNAAKAVFLKHGLVLLERSGGYSTVPLGIEGGEQAQRVYSRGDIKKVAIPGMSDVVDNQNREYNRAAMSFSYEFNIEMLKKIDER